MNAILYKRLLKISGYVLDALTAAFILWVILCPERLGVLLAGWFDRFFCSFMLTIDNPHMLML
jgi:hypothetical protein